MKSQLLASSLVAVLASTAASAADFTLNVPLRIENVPSMTRVTVNCLVSKQPVSGHSHAAGTNIVGRGSQTVNIVDGRYTGTARVEINASGINPAASGQSYTCSLSGWGSARTGATYAASPSNFQSVYETATGHTLDRVTTSTRMTSL